MSDNNTAKSTDENVSAQPDAQAEKVAKTEKETGRRFWNGFNKTVKTVLLGTAAVIGLAALVVLAPKVLLISARLLLPLLILGAAATGLVTIGRSLFSGKRGQAQDVKIDNSRVQSTRPAPDQSPKPSVSPQNGFNIRAQNDGADTVTKPVNDAEQQPANRKTAQNTQRR